MLTPGACGYYADGMKTPYPPQVQALRSYGHNEIVSYMRALPREEVVLTQYDAATLAANSGMNNQENLRKRVASIKYFDYLGAANTTFDQYGYALHFSYDIAGNVKTLVRDYPNWDRTGQRYKRVDYDYDVISGKVNMLSYCKYPFS